MIVTNFHAFTDKLDAFTETRAEADYIINKWRAEGYENLRIYEEQSDDQTDDEVNEDCIFAEGDFPW